MLEFSSLKTGSDVSAHCIQFSFSFNFVSFVISLSLSPFFDLVYCNFPF